MSKIPTPDPWTEKTLEPPEEGYQLSGQRYLEIREGLTGPNKHERAVEQARSEFTAKATARSR